MMMMNYVLRAKLSIRVVCKQHHMLLGLSKRMFEGNRLEYGSYKIVVYGLMGR